MDYYSSQINKLVEQLSNLPGIGAKSAQRLAFHILNMPLENVKRIVRFYFRSKGKCALLQRMFYTYGSGGLPDLQQSEAE